MSKYNGNSIFNNVHRYDIKLSEYYSKSYKYKSIDELLIEYKHILQNLSNYHLVKWFAICTLVFIVLVVPNTVANVIDSEEYPLYHNLLKWVLPLAAFIGIFFSYIITNGVDEEVNPYFGSKIHAIKELVRNHITDKNRDEIFAKIKSYKIK